MSYKVFDKVKWHYPEGDGCENLETAVIHFEAVLAWLNQHNLLSEYGKKLYVLGVDSDISITSEMLTKAGQKLLDKCYDSVLKNLEYGKIPSLICFEEYLRMEAENDSHIFSRLRKILENDQSPKEISQADAEWLIEHIESSGQMDDEVKAFLEALKENANIPSILSFKLKFWGI